MKNIPSKIYLQVNLDDGDEPPEDFKELHETSWCDDKIYENDIEYILTSSIQEHCQVKEVTDEEIGQMANEAFKNSDTPVTERFLAKGSFIIGAIKIRDLYKTQNK